MLNDHGADLRLEDGNPYLHSFMADNDLTFGRILHFLSCTKYWKNMLVTITEDHPNGAVSNIDAHASVLMMAGPYVKKEYTSHTHAKLGSVLKVIYDMLDGSYVNQYGATASLLQVFFTHTYDFSPYIGEISGAHILDSQKALDMCFEKKYVGVYNG